MKHARLLILLGVSIEHGKDESVKEDVIEREDSGNQGDKEESLLINSLIKISLGEEQRSKT